MGRYRCEFGTDGFGAGHVTLQDNAAFSITLARSTLVRGALPLDRPDSGSLAARPRSDLGAGRPLWRPVQEPRPAIHRGLELSRSAPAPST